MLTLNSGIEGRPEVILMNEIGKVKELQSDVNGTARLYIKMLPLPSLEY